MESLAVFPEGDFDSLNRMFAIDDELVFTQQQLHLFSFPSVNDEIFNFINQLNFCPNPEYSNMSSTDGFNIESNHIADWFPPTFPSIAMENSTVTVIERDQIDHSNSSDQNTKKGPRVSKDAPKKNCKINGDGGESNIALDGLSCSTTSSLEDNNGGTRTTSDSKASHGKRRASRGLATDPQSLYARKRRERINERLKILQHLVPNGTKVDISTMLEEAVHYVKFLQLQIKLLSSDDLWMYAPIAYNGIDIDLDKKINSKLQHMNEPWERSYLNQ